MNPPTDRLAWLDIAKGLGIVLVVAGHVLLRSPGAMAGQAASLIYLFHMPLFFVLAGVTLRRQPWREYALRKAVTLFVPYVFFLCLLGVPSLIESCGFGRAVQAIGIERCAVLPLKLFAGGSSLGGIFGAFWFIPCLYGALILAQLLLACSSATQRLILAFCALTLIAYAVPALVPQANKILAIGVVPMAALFVLTGCFSKKALPVLEPVILICSAAFALGTVLMLVPLDMKAGDYGIPLVSAIGAIAFVGLIVRLSSTLTRWQAPTVVFSTLGQRSLTILYLHQAIHLGLRHFGFQQDAMLFGLALVLPALLHQPVAWILASGTAALVRHLSPNSPTVTPPLP